jgi:hypothetical protein
MVKIYSSQNGVEVHNLKNVLEAQGIDCEIRGENLTAGLGELPVFDCLTELWVVDDSMVDDAKLVLSRSTRMASEPWNCPKCGESVEAEFGQCWNCQGDRPS